jgi:hypothetical protein
MSNLSERLDQLRPPPPVAPPEAFLRVVRTRGRRLLAVRAAGAVCILILAVAGVRLALPSTPPGAPQPPQIAHDPPREHEPAPTSFLARAEDKLRDPPPAAAGPDRILLAYGYRNPDLEHWVRN